MLGEEIGAETLGSGRTFALDMYTPEVENPQRDAWVEEFSAKHPEYAIEMNLLMGGMASLLMLDAIEEAGERDREAINDALMNMKLEKDDPMELLGIFTTPGPVWTPEGKPNSLAFIVEWHKEGGEWVKKLIHHPNRGFLGEPASF